jgi:hypothetical protein
MILMPSNEPEKHSFYGTLSLEIRTFQQCRLDVMKAIYVIAAAVILLCPSVLVQAGKVYTWTDKDGVLHITDQPPPATAKKVDVIPYEQQPPAVSQEVERRQQELHEQIIRDDLRRDADAARRRAQEAEKRAQEAVARANRISGETKETIQNLPPPVPQYDSLYARSRQMVQQAQAAQAEAKQAVEDARRAAAEARAAEAKLQTSPNPAQPTAE